MKKKFSKSVQKYIQEIFPYAIIEYDYDELHGKIAKLKNTIVTHYDIVAMQKIDLQFGSCWLGRGNIVCVFCENVDIEID